MSQPSRTRIDAERRAARRARDRLRRARLRAEGLRPVTLWVPDLGSPGMAEEIRRQSSRISEAEDGADWVNAWMDDQDTTGWARDG